MVPVRVGRSGIAAETFLPRVVVMIDYAPLPIVFTFDPEMIVRRFAQFARTRLRLMQTLRQDNGGRYSGTLLLGNGQRLIHVDINDSVRADLRSHSLSRRHQYDPHRYPSDSHQNLFLSDEK